MTNEPDYIIDGAVAILNACYGKYTISKESVLRALKFPKENRATEAVIQARACAETWGYKGGWQSIETALKDEDNYIVGKQGMVAITMMWDCEEEKWITFNRMWEKLEKEIPAIGKWQPTHWIHLPNPPTVSKKE